MTIPFASVRRGCRSGSSAPDNLQFDYQPQVDLLFAWVGDHPWAAEQIEVEEGVYVRVLRNTKRVVGIEVLDCAARFKRAPESVNLQFAKHLLDRYAPAALARL